MEDANVLQLKNRKFSDLYMCFCGYAKCSPLHNFGPAVRPNYIFHYILQGKGRFTVGEETCLPMWTWGGYEKNYLCNVGE